VAAAGLVLAFLAVAPDQDLGWNLPFAILGYLLATIAILDGLGTLDGYPTARDGARSPPRPLPSLLVTPATGRRDATGRSPRGGRRRSLCRAGRRRGAGPLPLAPLDRARLRGAGCFAALRLAVMGALPWRRLSAALLVTSTFLWVVVAVFRVAAMLAPGAARARPLLRRHGFWLIAIISGLYLPRLGSFTLVDPWETHYGEVAREMLVRGDWITLWWAQDGLFFSKPPLDFWLQGIAFSCSGCRPRPIGCWRGSRVDSSRGRSGRHASRGSWPRSSAPTCSIGASRAPGGGAPGSSRGSCWRRCRTGSSSRGSR
jgi:hypothetical protein